MLRGWLQKRKDAKELKSEREGYEWAYNALLKGEESAQSLQIWIDNGKCTSFERGCILAMNHLISIGAVEDTTI